MNKDKELLKWYMKGWNDELNGTSTIMACTELEELAYTLGATDAIVGDDISTMDTETEAGILERIKAQEVKPNLWDLTKDSMHVKFFQWMWGIYAPDRYKTACPYYWQFAGSMLIFPFILLAKMIKWSTRPMFEWIDDYTDRKANEYVAKLMKQYKNADFDKDLYDMYKSKCYIKYRKNLTNDIKEKIWIGYENYVRYLADKKRKRQIKIDSIKYGAVGTIVSYAIGFGLLFLAGWGVYEFVHLFTWGEFKYFLIVVAFLATVVAVFVGIVKFIIWLAKSCFPGSWVSKIVFWKYVAIPFKLLWTGIRMTANMIYNTYKNECPTINWK